MKIGAVFPTPEIGNDPAVIRDWAQTAEELGYDYILTYDHVLGAVHADRKPALTGPYTEHDAFHEPLTLFGFLAGVTSEIELTTGVIILPQRQTALVAKQAAELDLLSGGRLRLGVGTGWNWVEYEALGTSFEDRGKRFDEQVEVLRRLWKEPVVDFAGQHHRIDRAGILPRPPASIPLWFGALAPIALKRAARVGDGVILGGRPAAAKGMVERTLELLEENGREPVDFGFDASLDFSLGAETWTGDLELWREIGGTHCAMRAMDTGNEMMGLKRMNYSGPAAYIDALVEFKRAIG